MVQRIKTLKAILREVGRSSERSPLFWWLVDNHDQLVAQAGGQRMRWDALCKRFAAHGLTDTRGQSPNPRTARETWLQARRVVAEARVRKEAQNAQVGPGHKFPSRMSPDWRPQVVPQLAPPSGQTGVPAPTGLPALTTPPLPPVRPPQPPVTKGGAVTPPRRGRPRFIEDRSMFSAEAQQMLAELDDQFEDTDAYLNGF